MPNLIESKILIGKAKSEIVLIPRIPLMPTDMLFKFKRLQFPAPLSFTTSIKKARALFKSLYSKCFVYSCFKLKNEKYCVYK